jgi:hypothetical protein
MLSKGPVEAPKNAKRCLFSLLLKAIVHRPIVLQEYLAAEVTTKLGREKGYNIVPLILLSCNWQI